MDGSRRTFLKIAGISLLGLGVEPAMGWVSGSERPQVAQAPGALAARRWAMGVDMNRFQNEEGYRRVIAACHRVHNVPDIPDPKQEIKWIRVETYERVFPDRQDEYLPESLKKRPCVRVCPTQATFRRKDGIVAMDLHRCIGCRFCMVACPFGARSFNWRDPRPFLKEMNPNFPTRTKGVVEKCNFCEERLAQGREPACVEASQGGLVFGDLDDPHSEVRKILGSQYTFRRKTELGTKPCVFYLL
jgi:molybdopterin-containing oxidoreductase family iron-sulfur binding subunit